MKYRLRGLSQGCVWTALLVALVLGVPAWAVQATLVADAHVSSAQPDVNAGGLTNLNVGGGYSTLVQFDLGVLPAGIQPSAITRATLRLYCNRADTAGAVSVAPVLGAWSEWGVTFNTLPSVGPSLGSVQVSAAGEFVTVDVTSLVQAWVAGSQANDGVELTSGDGVLQFDSKENDQTSHAPELEIALASGTGGSGAVGATGAMGATGATGATGAQGVQGVAGPMGPVGPVGATGVRGATGPVGPTGATGQQGVAGLAGPTGAIGATGPTGATGATGAPGFVYQGVYSSSTNYALGDVVVWGGASYVSLVSGNHGQTPGQSPGAWGVLTAQGPVGPMGVTGATGVTGSTGALGPVGPPGEKGDQGSQGVAGQAGAQGIPGATGATGAMGPVGATGPAGPVGLSFQGAYSSSTSYGIGDGVFWQGAGWVSLVSNNHGNTPDQSPSDWAMFAAAGATGAVGATGPAGAAGMAGTPGATGATGAMGPTGATGATGAPGLAYRGEWQSASNYGLGDVVVWNGSSYASLVGSNHGNAPDVSPTDWGVLAAIGATGATGAQGAAGPTGPAGAMGPVGATGSAGPQGVQGPQGLQGPAGAQGLQGATGSAGPTGATGAVGPTGATGVQGVPGATGATGPQGVAGATGATGAVGMTFRGAYDALTSYSQGDGVLWQGAGWVSLASNNHGNAPDQSPADWSMFSAVGATGATGATGPQGVAGLVGPQGATGSTGPQGNAGPAGAAGAQGATGATGSTGAAGPVGMNFRGAWVAATYYAVNDTVTYDGSTYLALAAGSGPEPDISPASWTVMAQAGGAGPTGSAGAAATVTVGTVTTLAAGSQATVTNSGTSSAAVLNFGIPQGAQGPAGSGGSSTTSSGSFAAIYHSVNYTQTYFSVNTPNGSATETSTPGPSVLAWIPQGCTATRLDVESQQSGAITVTLRMGSSSANLADTALTCSTSSGGGTCSGLSSVSIPAGDFVDYKISGSSSTAAGVWTALTCN